METVFHNIHGASLFSDVYYKIELDEDAKEIFTVKLSQRLLKMCMLTQGFLVIHLPELHRINSEKTQGCGHLSIWFTGIGTTKEQCGKRMLVVKIRLRKTRLTINKKKSSSISSVSFLVYSVSTEETAHDHKNDGKIRNAKTTSTKKQLQSFVGLLIFYG